MSYAPSVSSNPSTLYDDVTANQLPSSYIAVAASLSAIFLVLVACGVVYVYVKQTRDRRIPSPLKQLSEQHAQTSTTSTSWKVFGRNSTMSGWNDENRSTNASTQVSLWKFSDVFIRPSHLEARSVDSTRNSLHDLRI